MTPSLPDEADRAYSRLAELAERIATEIGVSDPNWCELAADAAELARGIKERCVSST